MLFSFDDAQYAATEEPNKHGALANRACENAAFPFPHPGAPGRLGILHAIDGAKYAAPPVVPAGTRGPRRYDRGSE